MNFFQRAGAFLMGGGDALEKSMPTPLPTPPQPASAAEHQPMLPLAVDRPSIGPGAYQFFQQPNGRMERTQAGRPAITSFTLDLLSKTSPVAWSVINKYKTKITMMPWAVVPDLDHEKAELASWEKQAMAAVSPSADPLVFGPKFVPRFLPPEVAAPLRTAMVKIKPGPDARRRIRWLIDRAELEMMEALTGNASATEAKIKDINHDAPDPWRVCMERIIDDLCTHDLHGLGGVFSRGGAFLEAYNVPGAEIRTYKLDDMSTPQPPERAFSRFIGGNPIADYTTDDLLVMSANPQANGYGFSPLEAAAYLISASLQADAFNLDAFKSNIPPVVLNLGKMSPEQRERFRIWWNMEMTGKAGGLHRVFFTNLEKDQLSVEKLDGNKANDMEMMEYLRYCATIICACFQMSPQEIGFVKDFKYETSTNQMKITNEGVQDMARLIEGYMTEGLIRKFMKQTRLKFIFRNPQAAQDKDAVESSAKRISTGQSTINQERDARGERPLAEGGDTPFIQVGSTIIPVAKVTDDMDPLDTTPKPGDGSKDGEEGADGKRSPAPKRKEEKPKEGEDKVEKAVTTWLLAKAGAHRLAALKEERNNRNTLITGMRKSIRSAVTEAGKAALGQVKEIKDKE